MEIICRCWVLLSFPYVQSVNIELLMSRISGVISRSRTKLLHFTVGFFIPEILFSPYIICVNALSRILVQGVSLSFSLHISTFVSMKSDRSQGSKPISQESNESYPLESNEVTCSVKENYSIVVYCHVPHQTPAQSHDHPWRLMSHLKAGHAQIEVRTCEETAF